MFKNPDWRHFNVPLLQGTSDGEVEQIERPDRPTHDHAAVHAARQSSSFASRKTSRSFCISRIRCHMCRCFAASSFAGHSRAGLYGDVIEEIDWSVGQVLQELRD